MSKQQNILLAFCFENKEVATEINSLLSAGGFSFELHSIGNKREVSLNEKILQSTDPVILLISDNFIKSEACMHHGLHLVQSLSEEGRLVVLVTDGKYTNEQTKEIIYEPTVFERVSNVIKYMNYWQDVYMNLRKKKRSIPEGETKSFNEKLRTIRSISSSVGEFLRTIREINYYTYEDFSANNFESFFEEYSDYENFQRFKNITAGEIAVAFQKQDEKSVSVNINQNIHSINKNGHSDDNLTPITLPKEEEIENNLENNSIKSEISIDDPQSENLETEIALEKKLMASKETLAVAYVNIDEKKEEENEEEALIPNTNLLESNIESSKNDIDVEQADINLSAEKTLQNELNERTPSMAETATPVIDKEAIINKKVDIQAEITEALKNGATELAVQLYEKALEQDPSDNKLRYDYALSLAKYANDYLSASKQLEIILDKTPKYLEALFLLAELAEVQRDYILAKTYYEKVEETDPTYGDIYLKLGCLYANHFKNEPTEAARYFAKAIKIEAENEEAHYHFAVLLYEQMGEFDVAIPLFEKVLDLSPNHPFAHYDLAMLYYQKEDLEKAHFHYEKACLLNPELQTTENDRAFKLGKSEEMEVEETIDAAVQQITNEVSSEDNLPEENQIADQILEALDAEEEENEMPITKVVCITGASSGIGKAIAELFAQKGYDLILIARRFSRLFILKEEFESRFDTTIHILPFDVQKISDLKTAITSLPENLRDIDILINNAGVAKGFTPIHKGHIPDWEAMIDTNLKGVLYMTRAIAPLMVERQQGQIINICSFAGKNVYPNSSVYCATKHAIDALTKSMQLDLRKHNIRISQISPGPVKDTEFSTNKIDEVFNDEVYENIKTLTAKDIAETIYFIVTRPPHVNIQDIVIH